MKRILLSIAFVVAAFMPVLLISQTSYAVNINKGNNNVNSICAQPGAANSAYCQDTKSATNQVYGKHGAIVITSYIIASVAGVAAIIVIVIGGIRFMVSGGDPSSVASARNSIIYALIGLILIAAAETIFVYVLNKI
jgi:hypothetical protein